LSKKILCFDPGQGEHFGNVERSLWLVAIAFQSERL